MELNIDQIFQRGVAAHNQGNLKEAKGLYHIILQSQPDHSDVNHNLALIAMSENQSDVALPFLKTAVEANPKIEKYWQSYIDALVTVNRLKDAKRIIKKAKKNGVDTRRLQGILAQLKVPSQAQLEGALGHYQNAQYGVAESAALSLTNNFPKHQFGWKLLGALYGQSGRISKALNANQVAVALNPKDAEARYNLGSALQELGRLDAAEVSYKQAIALSPRYTEAHYNLGIVLQELGRLKEAEASYIRVIALTPNSAKAHCNLGNTLHALGRLNEAEASCRKALTLKSDFVEAYNNLGNTLRASGRLVEAEATFRKAISSKPGYAESHNNLGNTLRALSRLDEAEASYRQAIALKPNCAQACSNLGNTLQELGRLDEAVASYRHAIELLPDYAEAYSNLGNTLQDLGALEESERNYRQAIELKPDFADAHYNLGVLLFMYKKYRQATEHFELSDVHKSRLFSTKCLFLEDDKTAFYENFDLLLRDGEVNAVLESLAFRSQIKYGIEKSNPFCSDPLSYVVKEDLNMLYDFETIFVETARDVLSDKSVTYKAQGHLTNGVQTAGNIFTQGNVPKTEMEDIIRAEIEKYRAQFEDSNEGFIKGWPTSYDIRGWLVSMQSGGKLDPHMHDNGWITGSIYINVPPKSSVNGGNLVLCLDDQDHILEKDKTKQSIIDVVTGTLCLFPSSLHHYTVPFEEKEDRIVLAFDVIPKDKAIK